MVVVIIMAVKEEMRQSSTKSMNVHRGRGSWTNDWVKQGQDFNLGDHYSCPVLLKAKVKCDLSKLTNIMKSKKLKKITNYLM